MASEFQKNPFPVERIGRMQIVTVTAPSGVTIEIPFPKMKLVVINGQLCFSYDNFLMPIARKTTIDHLFGQ